MPAASGGQDPQEAMLNSTPQLAEKHRSSIACTSDFDLSRRVAAMNLQFTRRGTRVAWVQASSACMIGTTTGQMTNLAVDQIDELKLAAAAANVQQELKDLQGDVGVFRVRHTHASAHQSVTSTHRARLVLVGESCKHDRSVALIVAGPRVLSAMRQSPADAVELLALDGGEELSPSVLAIAAAGSHLGSPTKADAYGTRDASAVQRRGAGAPARWPGWQPGDIGLS